MRNVELNDEIEGEGCTCLTMVEFTNDLRESADIVGCGNGHKGRERSPELRLLPVCLINMSHVFREPMGSVGLSSTNDSCAFSSSFEKGSPLNGACPVERQKARAASDM